MSNDISGGLNNTQPGFLDKLLGPYPDVIAANVAIPNNDVDGHSFREGKIAAIGTLSEYKYYTWIGGYTDDKLVQFTPTQSDFEPVKQVAEQTLAAFTFDEAGNVVFYDSDGKIGLKLSADGLLSAINIAAGTLDVGKILKVVTDAVNNVAFAQSDNNALEFYDAVGRLGAVITKDMTLKGFKFPEPFTPNALITALVNNTKFTQSDKYALEFIDSTGKVGGYVTKDMKLVGVDVGITTKVLTENYRTDYVLIVVYGQSLSVGVKGQPVLTTVQRFNTLMPVGGIRVFDAYNESAYDPATYFASLVPLVENDYSADYGETSLSGLTECLVERIASEDKINNGDMDYNLLGVTCGYQGRNITQLSKGGTYYQWVIDAVTNCLATANAAGKTLSVGSIPFTQGEADIQIPTDPAVYKTKVLQLKTDLNTDIKALTGQSANIPLITYQTASANALSIVSFDISLKQLEMALDDNNDIYMACPAYQFGYYSDNVHMINTSYRRLGAYYGYVHKKVVIDGINWKPCHIHSYTKQASVIELYIYSPAGTDIVFDTTLVAAIANYGFRLFDALASEVTITSVTIPRKNYIRIVSPTPVLSGFKLTYGINGTALKTGSTQGARGNVRDKQGDAVIFNPKGDNYPLHNWLPISQIIF